jgi:uncharacterized protein (DUF1330 family)
MLHAQAKPPAYLISAVMIIDPAGYKEYADKFAPTQVHSPRRSDRCPSGCGRPPRSVVIMFENLEKAKAWSEVRRGSKNRWMYPDPWQYLR